MIKVSPSQVTLWRTCKRKFAFNYFTTLPKQPETKALQIGNAAHLRMELYLKSGTPDYSYEPGNAISYAASRILTAIVPYLPKPADAVAEGTFITHHAGITFSGRLDWRVPGLEIGDLKTTSNMRYRKTEKELEADPQALLYSLAFPGLRCRWLYAPTSGGKPEPVVFHADMAHLDALLEDAHAIADAWATRPDPLTLDANTEACYLYNTACPYLAQCGAKPPLFGPRAPGVPQVSMQAFLSKIKAPTAPVPVQTLPVDIPVQGPDLDPDVTDGVAQDAAVALDAPVTEPTVDTPAPKAKRSRRLSPPEAIAAPVAETLPAPSGGKPIGILLIDCFPRGLGPFLDFATDVLPKAKALIVESAEPKVADYRFIPFRGAAGALAGAVLQVLGGIAPGTNVTVDSRQDESRDVLATLEAAATATVRGY